MKISAISAIQEKKFPAPLVKEPVKISSRFCAKLQQLLFAEQQMCSLLAKAKKAANDLKLKAAINTLIQSGREKCQQLEQAFHIVNSNANGNRQVKPCGEFMLLTSDFEPCIDITDIVMRDAAIIFEIQKMIQFKIDHYSMLCELADEFNNQQMSALAEKILQSEICCDASIMELSVSYLGEDELMEFLED